MGALMGQRSESGAEVDVRSCFAVPHSENAEQIALDMPFQQSMVELMNRNGVKEQVVGW
jgi:translation initiation factor 3 subunit F